MKKLFALLSIMLLTVSVSVGQQIQINSISKTLICAGSALGFTYTTTFPIGTELTVFISDSAGLDEDFYQLQPVVLTVQASTGNSVVLPVTMKNSNLYTIKIAAKLYDPNGYNYFYDGSSFKVFGTLRPAKIFASSLIECKDGNMITLDDSYGSTGSRFYLNASTSQLLPHQVNPSNLSVGQHSVRMVSSVNSATCGLSQKDTIMLTINGLPPVPTITESAGMLTSSATSGNQWFDTVGSIAGAVNQTLAPPASGKYTVEVTNSSGCKSTSLPYTYTLITTGIEQSKILRGIALNVFPNPSQGKVTVAVESETLGEIEITLTTMEGKTLSKNSSELVLGQTLIPLDLTTASKGIYFVSVKLKGSNENIGKPFRLIVQ